MGGSLLLTINGWIWPPYGTTEKYRTIHNYPGNVLAQNFGVVSNNDYYIDDFHKHPKIQSSECFVEHPITEGIQMLDTAHGVISTLNVSRGLVLIRGSMESESTWGLGPYKKGSCPPLLVAIEYGNGRIVITGLSNGAFLDSDSDNDGARDIDEFDNKQLALNIFNWLSARINNIIDIPRLVLYTPEIDGLNVSINGVTVPENTGKSVTSIHWDWGDGYEEDCWFPASHTYKNPGEYVITVTSYQSDGLYTTKSIVVRLLTTPAVISTSTPIPATSPAISAELLVFTTIAVITLIVSFILVSKKKNKQPPSIPPPSSIPRQRN